MRKYGKSEKTGKHHLYFDGVGNKAKLVLLYPDGNIDAVVKKGENIELQVKIPFKIYDYVLRGRKIDAYKKEICDFVDGSKIRVDKKGANTISYFQADDFLKWLKKISNIDDTAYEGCALLSHWINCKKPKKHKKTCEYEKGVKT